MYFLYNLLIILNSVVLNHSVRSFLKLFLLVYQYTKNGRGNSFLAHLQILAKLIEAFANNVYSLLASFSSKDDFQK